ncbi:MAG: ABC-F family ATP-binding cassette domain-containing protein [Anaerolineaceae bacterium]|nr:ABC-F family ATP-binding cassette domain-containing protein [Anaerolineaceae bacterium]
MIRIRLDKVTFSYPSKPIFREASCELQEGCYGVIGPNGSGKSTLLKLILGELKPDSGFLLRDKALTVAYMAQDVDLDLELTAYEAAREGAHQVLTLEAELAALEGQFADPEVYGNEKRLARLIDRQEALLEHFAASGGPGLEGRIRTLLTSIGFDEHEMELPVANLSGGQKKLLGLAKIIIGRPDILLLDEPDNHLDLDGKAMLQRLIEDFNGTVVIVSHDRYFLDMVADAILEVDLGRIAQFPGNYSEYMFDKQVRLAKQAERFQAQQKEITRLEQAAKRLLMWGKVYDNPKFSNRGNAILKRLDKLDRIEKPILEHDKIEISLGGWRGSEKVLEVREVGKGFPSQDGERKAVLEAINLLLRYGDRVGMIGPNGVGKSLLVRIILGREQADSGEVILGPSIKPGYYAQEFETLDPNLTLLETICKAGNFSESRGVAFLKKYLFDYDQRDTAVGALSGGERARLQIALITLTGSNFLLLDEPTNHLDIPSCEVLEDALLAYDGTILAISHDRYFLDRIANRIVELQGDGVNEFLGNYSDYESYRRQSAGQISR